MQDLPGKIKLTYSTVIDLFDCLLLGNMCMLFYLYLLYLPKLGCFLLLFVFAVFVQFTKTEFFGRLSLHLSAVPGLML